MDSPIFWLSLSKILSSFLTNLRNLGFISRRINLTEQTKKGEQCPPFSLTHVNNCYYSHSMVPGGLEVISNTTRLTPLTSLTILLEIASNTS
jgi:hypothetical protein